MPTTGPLKLNPGTAADSESGYRSRFPLHSEIAEAVYYSVVKDDYQIQAELMATGWEFTITPS